LLDPCVSGQKTLEAIEHANLFIVPLDHERRWYRYHHLFADLLRQRLHQLAVATPEGKGLKLSDLHMRASIWYEENDLRAKALHHAFAADDFDRAANLIELAWPEMDQSYRNDAWLVWLKKSPEKIIRARPVLCAGYAWALLDKGEVDDIEPLLRDAERWLDASTETSERSKDPPTKMVVADPMQFQSLPASIAGARATRALILGNVSETLNYALMALDIVPENDHFRRGAIAGTLGIAYWTCGDLDAAYRHLNDCVIHLQMAGHIHLASSVTFVLADIRQVQGRLPEAVRAYESSLQLVAASNEAVPLASADLYLGLSALNREQGDMEAAAQHLRRSKELGELAALPGWQYRWYLAQARVKEDQGDFDAALTLLYDAEHLDLDPLIPDLRPITALKARVWLRQGKLTKALDWAREQAVSFDDDLSFMREYDHITLARVLVAEYKVSRSDHAIVEAAELLERLKKSAEKGGRMGSLIEILVLQALAYQAQDNIPSALIPFARALSLAEPGGYVRIFVDEGMEMTRLLSESAAHKIMPDYVRRLLAAFETEKQKSEGQSYPPQVPADQLLVEPLSKRELEVLRLIAQGLSNRAIGERLFVALDTVKGHNRNMIAHNRGCINTYIVIWVAI
jgi:LuxR family maltose regulon positive regulatory protein